MSRCLCQGRLGTLKTPSWRSCPWRWVPGSSLNLETGQLSHHYTAEIWLNVTLNHNQPTMKKQNENLLSNMQNYIYVSLWNLDKSVHV